MDLFSQYGRMADSAVDSSGLAYTRRKSVFNSKQVDTDDTIEFKRQLALQMYQNDYNSPPEQFNRLVAAGVSPFDAAKAVSGNIQGASNAQGVAGTGLEQNVDTRAGIQMLGDLISQSLGFANQMIGLVDSSQQVKFGIDTFDARKNSIILNNLLTSNRSSVSYNSAWLGALRNAAYSSAVGLGGYNGEGIGFDLDLSPDQISGLSDYFSNMYNSKLTKTKVDELDYKVKNILPEILRKYGVSNEQQEYMMDVLDSLPPEVRQYLVLGMEIFSTFISPVKFPLKK